MKHIPQSLASPTKPPATPLPLPPQVRWPDLLRCAWRMARGGSTEEVLRLLYRRYGPVVLIQPQAPAALIRLLERMAGIDAKPYVLLVGPEANRFLMTAPPAQIQRAPTIAARFPSDNGDVQRQYSIASIDGETQKEHHQLAMRPFRPKHMASYIPTMRAALARRAAGWGDQIDLYAEMSVLAFETLVWTMLGIAPDMPRYAELTAAYWPLFSKDRTQGRMWQAKRAMWTLIDQIIDERRAAPGPDAASALIVACDQHDGTPVSREMLRNYLYMLIEFGHGDIAIYQTYATAVLALRPDLLDRMRDEHASYSDAAVLDPEHRLPFTLSLLREVERCYSPVTFLMRYAAADLTFGGYRIPRGSWLLNSMDLTNQLPTVFPDPEHFDPDRFASPRLEHKVPFALIGFGAGHHICIANSYTRMYGCVILHELLESYKLVLKDMQRLPKIDYRGAMQVPARPILLTLTPR